MNKQSEPKTWEESAYDMLQEFLCTCRKHEIIMGEDIRNYAEEHNLPQPVDKRIWGGIIKRAAKDKLIKKIGYNSVSNKLAHNTPASLWQIL